LGVPVRKSVRFAEAPYAGRSILAFAGSTPGAAAYRVLAAELVGADVDPALREAAGGLPEDLVEAGGDGQGQPCASVRQRVRARRGAAAVRPASTASRRPAPRVRARRARPLASASRAAPRCSAPPAPTRRPRRRVR